MQSPVAGALRDGALAAVGTMTVSFSGGNAATLSYTVNGVAVTKQITRQVFGIPATQCATDE